MKYSFLSLVFAVGLAHGQSIVGAPQTGTPITSMRPGVIYIDNTKFPKKTRNSIGRSTAVDHSSVSALDGTGHCPPPGDGTCPGRWPGEANATIGRNGGAMRIFSHFSHFAYDDPIVYPGQAGRSHLHAFFGNTETRGVSTPLSIRTTGNSTNAGGTFNRSAYWVPAMIYVCDTPAKITAGCNPARNGEPILPVENSGLNVYYKGYFGIGMGTTTTCPSGDACNAKNTWWNFSHTIEPFPVGFRMISGTPSATPSSPGSVPTQFVCLSSPGDFEVPTTWIAGTGMGANQTAYCQAGTFELKMIVPFPTCGNDAQDLDSPTHNAHIVFKLNNSPTTGGDSGDFYCPTGYSHYYPGVSFRLHYPYPGDNEVRFWRLSSDRYDTSLPAGYSAHGDWFNGWDSTIMALWVTNCLVIGVDCHDNVLGPVGPPTDYTGGSPWRLLTPPIGTLR